MNTAITTIEELGIRKDAALANQEKLIALKQKLLRQKMESK